MNNMEKLRDFCWTTSLCINSMKNLVSTYLCVVLLLSPICIATLSIEKMDENFRTGEANFANDEYVRSKRQTEVTSQQDPSMVCPKQCVCLFPSEIKCTFTTLTKMPASFPTTLEKINIAYNKIKAIRNHAFDEHGDNLRLLYMQSNEITSLPSTAFGKLNGLSILRLSWNKITAIKKTTLHGLHNVERIYLDNNRIAFIHPLAFRGLVNLKLLQLDGNQLSVLHRDSFLTTNFAKVFRHSSIQFLYMAKNALETLPDSFFDDMPNLRQVYLQENPWRCSCDERWLRTWMEEDGLYSCNSNQCATCESPPSLRGQKMTSVPLNNFSCFPPNKENEKDFVISKRFEDVESLEMQSFNEEITLFRYTNFYASGMNMRLDSEESSLMYMRCNTSRVPEVAVNEIFLQNKAYAEKGVTPDPNEKNLSKTNHYIGTYEATLQCQVEYPTDSQTLRDILEPYLDHAVNFTVSDQRSGADLLEYYVSSSRQSPIDETLLDTPITRAGVASNDDILLQNTSLISFVANDFNPEDGSLRLLYSTKVNHMFMSNDDDISKAHWELISQPSSRVVITIQRKSTSLRCKAIGQPKPLISWVLPSEESLSKGQSSGRFSVSRSGRLFIRRTEVQDAGLYRCVASIPCNVKTTQSSRKTRDRSNLNNMCDDAISISSYRVVVVNRLIGESTLTEVKKLKEVKLVEAEEWTAKCPIKSSLPSSVAWVTADGRLFSDESKTKETVKFTKNNELKIQTLSLENSGVFRCVSANREGVAVAYIPVRVLSKEEFQEVMDLYEYEEYYDLYGESEETESTKRPHEVKLTEGVIDTTAVAVITKPQTLEEDATIANEMEQQYATTTSTYFFEENQGKNETQTTAPVLSPSPEDLSIIKKLEELFVEKEGPTEIDAFADFDVYVPNVEKSNTSDIDEVTTTKPTLVQTSTKMGGNESVKYKEEPMDNYDAVNEEDNAIMNTFEEDKMKDVESHEIDVDIVYLDGDEMYEDEQSEVVIPKLEILDENDSRIIEENPTGALKIGESEINLDNEMEDDILNIDRYISIGESATDLPEQEDEDDFTTSEADDSLSESLLDEVLAEEDEKSFEDLENEVEIQTDAVPVNRGQVESTTSGVPTTLQPSLVTSEVKTPQTSIEEDFKIKEDDNQVVVIDVIPTSFIEESLDVEQTTLPAKKGYPPKFIDETNIIKVDVKERATIHCLAIANPKANCTWHMADGTVVSYPFDSWHFTALIDGSIIIKSTLLRDAGSINLTASNSFGSVSKNIELKVIYSAPEIAQEGVRQAKAVVGRPLGLPCMATGTPAPKIKWQFPNGRAIIGDIGADETAKIFSNGMLYFNSVDSSVHGEYICTATNIAGTTSAKTVVSVLNYKPKIKPFEQEVYNITRGGTITIPCIVNGLPQAKISWIGPRGEIIPDTPRAPTTDTETLPSIISATEVQEQGFSTLSIQNSNLIDSGAYTCKAENSVGAVTFKVVVNVIEPEEIIMGPAQFILDHLKPECGKRMSIHCKLPGFISPSARPMWTFPDGREISVVSSTRTKARGMTILNNATLIFSNAHPRLNGTYNCESTNPPGSAFYSVVVDVTCERPRITSPAEEVVVVKYGESQDILCLAEGTPKPRVNWRSLTRTQATFRGNVLKLIKVTRNGAYECRAANSVGSASKRIKVEAMVSAPKFINEASTELTVERGSEVMLDCASTGSPTPMFSWIGTDASIGATISQSRNGSLVIRNVQDIHAREFKCFVNNIAGSKFRNFKVNVIDPTTPATTTEEPELLVEEIKSQVITTHPVYFSTVQRYVISTPKRNLNNGLDEPDLDNFERAPKGTIAPPLISVQNDAESTSPKVLEDDVLEKKKLEIQKKDPVMSNVFSTTLPTLPQNTTTTQATTTQVKTTKQSTTTEKLNTTISTPITNSTAQSLLNTTSLAQSTTTRRKSFYPPKAAIRVNKEYSYSSNGYYGTRHKLHCYTHLRPPSAGPKRSYAKRIIWTLPSGERFARMRNVSPRRWKYYIFNNGTLMIRKLSMKDNGKFSCLVVDNFKRTIRTRVNMQVILRRPFIREPRTQLIRARPGSRVKVGCTAVGYPEPKVRWRAPDGQILLPGSWSPQLTVYANATMSFASITNDESGKYLCLAYNQAGNTTRQVLIHTVKSGLRRKVGKVGKLVPTSGPTFLQRPTRVTHVKTGNSVRLPCTVSGNPKPRQEWTLNQGQILRPNQAIFSSGYKHPKLATLTTGMLILNRAQKSDAGRYYCRAYNKYGRRNIMVILRVY